MQGPGGRFHFHIHYHTHRREISQCGGEISFLFRPNPKLAAELIFFQDILNFLLRLGCPQDLNLDLLQKQGRTVALLCPCDRHALCPSAHCMHPDVALPLARFTDVGTEARGHGITRAGMFKWGNLPLRALKQSEMATERKSPDGINLACLSTTCPTLFLCFL